MFKEFELLQDKYRNEAAAWAQGETLSQDAPYPEKIEFAVSSVRELDLPQAEKVQRAYHRCRAVLGAEADSIPNGDFQKGLMPYYLENGNRQYNSGKGYLEEKITEVFKRHVLNLSYNDHRSAFELYNLEDHPLTLAPQFQKFLDAGEHKELSEVLLSIAYHTDGEQRSKDRQMAMNSSVAKLMSKLTGRSDIHEADIEMLRENGDLTPKRIWQSDFYLDHVVEPVSDALLVNAKHSIPYRFPDDSVFWKIRDDLSDQEIFNLCISSNDKDLGLSKWVQAMALFEAITEKPITIREALAFDPEYRFALGRTAAFKAYLDGEGAQDPADYQNVDVDWEDQGYDKDDEVFRSSITLHSHAFKIPEVEEMFGDMTLSIGPVRSTVQGIEAFTCELEFESKNDMLKERQGIRIALQKNLQEIMKKTPIPGDTVALCVPEGYEEEDVEFDSFKVGDTGKVTAFGYFGGSVPAYKIEGVDSYFNLEELDVINRPKLSRKPQNELSI